MARRIFTGLLVVMAVLMVSATGFAVSLFGPQRYIRTAGHPDVFTETVAGAPGEWFLVVRNGDADGAGRVSSATPGPGFLTVYNGEADGRNRVASATITVNGEKIFDPKYFKKKDDINKESVFSFGWPASRFLRRNSINSL